MMDPPPHPHPTRPNSFEWLFLKNWQPFWQLVQNRESLNEKYYAALTGLMKLDDLNLMLQ